MWSRRTTLGKSFTWDQLRHQTATKKHFSDEKLYRLDIARVHLINKRRVWAAFYAIQQAVSQVSCSLSCVNFGLANCLNICLVGIHIHWLFAKQNFPAWQVFMNTFMLINGMVSDHTDEVLAWGRRYQHIITSHLGLAIGIENIRVLVVEHAATRWRKF